MLYAISPDQIDGLEEIFAIARAPGVVIFKEAGHYSKGNFCFFQRKEMVSKKTHKYSRNGKVATINK